MNDDLKRLFREMKVPQWKVAEELGISESVFCRRLRKELDVETELKIYAIIDKLGKADETK